MHVGWQKEKDWIGSYEDSRLLQQGDIQGTLSYTVTAPVVGNLPSFLAITVYGSPLQPETNFLTNALPIFHYGVEE